MVSTEREGGSILWAVNGMEVSTVIGDVDAVARWRVEEKAETIARWMPGEKTARRVIGAILRRGFEIGRRKMGDGRGKGWLGVSEREMITAENIGKWFIFGRLELKM